MCTIRSLIDVMPFSRKVLDADLAADLAAALAARYGNAAIQFLLVRSWWKQELDLHKYESKVKRKRVQLMPADYPRGWRSPAKSGGQNSSEQDR